MLYIYRNFEDKNQTIVIFFLPHFDIRYRREYFFLPFRYQHSTPNYRSSISKSSNSSLDIKYTSFILQLLNVDIKAPTLLLFRTIILRNQSLISTHQNQIPSGTIDQNPISQHEHGRLKSSRIDLLPDANLQLSTQTIDTDPKSSILRN